MTYFIGLDLAKYKHDCFIMNESGEVIKDSFSFDNNKSGFNTLLNVLKSLDPNQEKRIGLESTGHYGSNLKIFLEDNNYTFMEFNPILISKFLKATTLRRTKTDKIDARVIAIYLSTVSYKPYPIKYYHLRNLKSLCKSRDSLVKERSLQMVRITNALDLIFPEFKPFFGKQAFKSASFVYLLTNYTLPSKISNMTIESYNKMKHKLKHPISYAKFLEVKKLAKETIGNEDPILTFEIETYLDLYKDLDSKINKFESLILEEYKTTNCHIHTIKGIGDITAASIYSEIGDISRFSSPDKLQAFAGLDPSRYQSGTSDVDGHMVKHGFSYLRKYLMNSAEMMLIHNPTLYDYYHKKIESGKSHRVALSHVAKRLIRIIYHLEKYNTNFDINKIR